MDWLQALVLGVVQGLTEFAPVSSSAHLVIVPWLLRWPEPGLAFDTTVHLGTLAAVLSFFWHDLWAIAEAWWRNLFRRTPSPEGHLGWLIIFGTAPAAAMGGLFGDWFEEMFHHPTLVGGLLVVTAGALLIAERWGRQGHSAESLSLVEGLFVGLAQGFAIAPGISRSGFTIAAGMLLGTERAAAARFSFLLSVPIIAGAGGIQLAHLLRSGGAEAHLAPLVIGFLAAAISGYLCIGWLLRFLRRSSLRGFAGYCGLLGVAVALVAWLT